MSIEKHVHIFEFLVCLSQHVHVRLASGSCRQRLFFLSHRTLIIKTLSSWNRLPREVVESPSLEIFKNCLDKVLCSLLWVTLLRQGGWTR